MTTTDDIEVLTTAHLPDDWSDVDTRAVDTARVLAADAVQKVGNGHPGTAMSLAPLAYTLFQQVMRHDPADPHWVGRDRFVLSCGHSSLTLYIQLYLAGFGLELKDLQALRTWGSLTPGHPEYHHTKGVEITTGPLGQGLASAVGMAMAARRERGLFDPDAAPGESIFDHFIYVVCSDGDLEEGVTSEASSIAGRQELGNLIVFYDHNEISIEDDTNIAFDEDVPKRYEAYGWHVQTVEGGENVVGILEAIEKAKAVTDKPSFIQLRTIIGYPAPNLQNTGKAHGAALGDAEIAAVKKILGFDPDQSFQVDDVVIKHTRQALDRGEAAKAAWQPGFDEWAAANPERKALFDRITARELPDGWTDALPSWPVDPKGVATRAASGKVLSALADELPELWGGSADLAESNNTTMAGADSFGPVVGEDQGLERPALRPDPALRDPRARDGLDPDRDRHARPDPPVRRHVPDVLRLHARRGPVGRGDGRPGHLRLDPRLDRPRRGRPDPPAGRAPGRAAGHSRVCPSSGRAMPTRPRSPGRPILERQADWFSGPVGICLTRQPIPTLDGTSAEGVSKGAYVLADADGDLQVILLASGSELQIAVAARETLQAEGIGTRVVSVPCLDWFEAQDSDYIESVLPSAVTARVSIEAGIAQPWWRWIGSAGRPVSLEHYGASADAKTLFTEFGITAEHAVANAKESLAAAKKAASISTASAPEHAHHAGEDDPSSK